MCVRRIWHVAASALPCAVAYVSHEFKSGNFSSAQLNQALSREYEPLMAS